MTPENRPRFEGRRLTVMLLPKAEAVKPAVKNTKPAAKPAPKAKAQPAVVTVPAPACCSSKRTCCRP